MTYAYVDFMKSATYAKALDMCPCFNFDICIHAICVNVRLTFVAGHICSNCDIYECGLDSKRDIYICGLSAKRDICHAASYVHSDHVQHFNQV